MNKIFDVCLEIPLIELKFKSYSSDGIEKEFPPNPPWLFEVLHESFPTESVLKVELPPLDYLNNDRNIKAKVHLQFVYDTEKNQYY
jgi:hypothetical protein